MTNLETLRAQLAAKREQAEQALAERIEVAQIRAELNLLENDKFQQALAEQTLREQATSKLDELNLLCASIVTENPVYSTTLKKDREWKPSKLYGYGNQIAELMGLLNGIQYSVSEHNSLMLAATGLSKDLIESTLSYAGQLPYYSTNHSTIVEGTRMDVEGFLTNLQLIEQVLGVQLDKRGITQAKADTLYAVAQAKAEKAEAEVQLGETVQQFVIR